MAGFINLKTALYTHKNCLAHDPGEGHPESPMRLQAILGAMRKKFPERDAHNIAWVQAPLASEAQILLGHSKIYWQDLSRKDKLLNPGAAPISTDSDTRMGYRSLEAALRGAGAACQAVNDLLDRKYRNAFCVTRPPGHHALRNASMGFCLLNNIAIAAKYALTKANIKKIAIVDYDVHQGNGTEDIVKDDPRILFYSIHQQPLWPYLHHEDKGPHGNINNIPMPPQSAPELYHKIFYEQLIPALHDWRPDIIFLSAGFDAHRDDPPPETLFNDPPGRQMLLEPDFNRMTEKLMTVADQHAQGRLISILEGGYNTEVLAKCCVEHALILSASR